jgi:hypothetical protein
MIYNVNNEERNDYQDHDDDQLKGGTGEAGTSETDDEEVLTNDDDLGDLDLDADMEDDDLGLDEYEDVSPDEETEGTP